MQDDVGEDVQMSEQNAARGGEEERQYSPVYNGFGKCKEIYSEGARSVCFTALGSGHPRPFPAALHSSSPSSLLPQRCQGDLSLKNKARFSHNNHPHLSTPKPAQSNLPSHYFTPTKNKLDLYLRHSRVLPNREHTSG